MRIVSSLCVVLFAATLFAQNAPVITSVSPEQIAVNSGEHFLTVRGRNFWLWPQAQVTISGPAGTSTLVANTLSDSWLEVWVRTDIVATVGRYSVVVENPDGGISEPQYFEVIDAPRPILYLSPTIQAEATGPNGANVKFEAQGTTSDGQPATISCTHESGALFPVGSSTISCTATDERRDTSTTRNCIITVVDTTPPVMTLPDDFGVEATGPDGAKVAYEATAVDIVDGHVSVNCSMPSGSTFAIGTTTVGCTAVDNHSRSTYGSFKVTVFDNLRPTLMLPDDINVETTREDGEIVTYTVTARDRHERPVPVMCLPESGARFRVGTTTVACSATDDEERTSTGTFSVTVTKTGAPPPSSVKLNLPPDITVEAMSSSGTVVEFEATAEEDGQPVAVSCAPASGSLFPVGTTTVNCSATGSDGETVRGSFLVHVLDSNAPVIRNVSASPDVLWPPNGKLSDITITASADDEIDTNVEVRVINVTANEAIDADDWKITGPLTLQLRAERNGSNGPRIYTIVVEAVDDSGNSATATTTVRVPHDGADSAQPSKKGKRRAVGK